MLLCGLLYVVASPMVIQAYSPFLTYIFLPFVPTNPTKFLSRALSFPFQVGFMGDDDLGGPTPQFSPQTQIPHPTRERGGSDLEQRSSESMVTNKTERVLIACKFATTNLSDR